MILTKCYIMFAYFLIAEIQGLDPGPHLDMHSFPKRLDPNLHEMDVDPIHGQCRFGSAALKSTVPNETVPDRSVKKRVHILT